jgi:hypothetical protein
MWIFCIKITAVNGGRAGFLKQEVDAPNDSKHEEEWGTTVPSYSVILMSLICVRYKSFPVSRTQVCWYVHKPPSPTPPPLPIVRVPLNSVRYPYVILLVSSYRCRSSWVCVCTRDGNGESNTDVCVCVAGGGTVEQGRGSDLEISLCVCTWRGGANACRRCRLARNSVPATSPLPSRNQVLSIPRCQSWSILGIGRLPGCGCLGRVEVVVI